MKIEEIQTIVKLMADNDLTEFKIEAEEMHLCIRRGSSVQPAVTLAGAPQVVHAAPTVAAPVEAAPAKEVEEDRETIDSPIVGTFYRASSPESDVFVKVGDTVEAETVVCIIEAMKVMNEIKADKSGTIKEILVDNAQPVEYGQSLFVIE